MADDWDLYAVVRGCKSTNQTTRNITVTATGIAPTNPIHTPPDEVENDPFWELLDSDELTDPLFSITNLDVPKEANGFQELQQSFFRNPTTTTNNDHDPTTNNTTFGPNNIISNSSTISDFGGSSGSGQHHLQHQQQQQQHHAQLQQQQLQQQQHLSMPTRFTRGIPAPGFRGIYGQQQQQQIIQPGDQNLQPEQLQTQQGFRRPRFINPAYPHPRLPTRPQRRRKTQQKKNVHEVKAEDLISADLWAWRKYGQKPIKGSPHPRNYYRCSSSKGCPARRQVEQSTTEPNIFIVTYTGDHTHARPTHRNSLAGSSRNKLSAASASQKHPINNDSGLPMTVQAEAVPVANKVDSDNSLDKENEEFDEEEETDHENENENEVEDDDVVIPDMDMSDEIFLGLKELGGTSSNGTGSGSFSGL